MRLIRWGVGAACLLGSVSLAFAQTAPPATDIYLADLTSREGRLSAAAPINITNRPGYDNQPSFMPDGQSLLFTSIREGTQADIYRYELANAVVTRLTATPESEYSGTAMRDLQSFSVVRVEADSTQRLWKFPFAGGPPALVLDQVKPVGYHAWLDDDRLALFVLGTPNTLQLVDRRTQKPEVILSNIGRSLAIRPGQDKLTFVHKLNDKDWVIKELSLKDRKIAPVVSTLPGSEDFIWIDENILLMASENKLYQCDLSKGIAWQQVADFSKAGLKSITRLAVSPRGNKLAFVALPETK